MGNCLAHHGYCSKCYTGHFGYANDIISYRPDIIFIHFVNVQQLYNQFTYLHAMGYDEIDCFVL